MSQYLLFPPVYLLLQRTTERGPEAVLEPKCLPKAEKTRHGVIIILLQFLEISDRDRVAPDSTENTANQLEA